MRRLAKGEPLRAAMQTAGLDIPRLAARIREIDPSGAPSRTLLGFITGTGKSARESCSDPVARLIARALDVPVEALFDVPDSVIAGESTSTPRSVTTVSQDLPDPLLDQRGLADYLRKSKSWIDAEIRRTRDLPEEEERFPVHYVGTSRRFDRREVLAYLRRRREAQKAAA